MLCFERNFKPRFVYTTINLILRMYQERFSFQKLTSYFCGKLIELEELDIQIQAINLFTICQVS